MLPAQEELLSHNWMGRETLLMNNWFVKIHTLSLCDLPETTGLHCVLVLMGAWLIASRYKVWRGPQGSELPLRH